MKRRIILGVDPGTAITGYGLIEEGAGRYVAIDFGAIRPPRDRLLSERYLLIYEAILSIIDQHQPQALSIETQYVSKNVMSAMKLGMARSVVMLAAKQRGMPVFAYTPSKAKKAVVGIGSASKEQVQKMVQSHLRLSELPTPEDAADALALAICHAHSPGLGEEI